MNLLLRKLRDKIREKHPELSREDVEDVLQAEFAFCEDIIKSGSLEKIRLQYLGVFEVKDTTKERVLEKRHEKQQKLFTNGGSEAPSTES